MLKFGYTFGEYLYTVFLNLKFKIENIAVVMPYIHKEVALTE